MENTEKYYKLSAAEVLEELNVKDTGLNQAQVEDSRKKYGPNIIKEGLDFSIWKLFWAQFSSPLVYILVFAAVITYLLGHYFDTMVIFGVLVFNAVLGFFQEYKAENSTQALKNLLKPKAKVIRDGKHLIINSTDLVVGDTLVLRAGDKISADARILKCNDLRIDEAVLTGESTLIEKNSDSIPQTAIVAERKNIIFSGTTIISGDGSAVIVAIGKETEFGKIAESISKVEKILTPFQMRMILLSSWIVKIVLGLSILIVGLGLARGYEFLEILLVGISTMVAAIPEGLPAIITIVLAIGVSRMVKRNAIVRKLVGVETLGSISVIASDKTGTLTYGEMTITDLYTGNNYFRFDGSGYEPKGKVYLGEQILHSYNQNLKESLRYAIACSDASIYKEKERWKVDGDPTEAALVVAAEKIKIKKADIEKQLPRIDTVPFDTTRHYMATLHKNSGQNILVVKGTIEKILNSSTRYYLDGEIVELTPEKKAQILKANNDFASRALRVIAIAYKECSSSKKVVNDSDVSDLVFMSLAGMIDSPRREVHRAINDAKSAGIKVLMITGDHMITASAIAKQLGLIDSDQEVMDGEELAKISEERLAEKLEHIRVFARISPTDKLKIVKILQDKGAIVSVTGDGVNDAPALRQADVGVAMGISGTDVAREASVLVLTDDNFSTIVAAIEEGRVVIQNIKRTVIYLLSTNTSEISLIVLSLLFGLPTPFTAVQILWINVVTDGTSDTALALEPKHRDVMQYPPKPRNQFFDKGNFTQMITVAVVMTIGVAIMYIWALNQGKGIEYARTIAFTTMVFFQIFNLFNCRSLRNSIFHINIFSNLYVLGSAILSFILFFFTVWTELGREIFNTTFINIQEIFVIILISFGIIIAVEIQKYLWRRKYGRNN
ncbi:cation-translocating P-type ATPase [Patescibacteria group bacterium]